MNSSLTKNLLLSQDGNNPDDGVILHLQQRQDLLTRQPREELNSYNREELDLIEDFFLYGTNDA